MTPDGKTLNLEVLRLGVTALLEFTSRLPNGSSTRTSLGFDLAVGDDMQPILMIQSPSAASKRAFSSILTPPLAFTINCIPFANQCRIARENPGRTVHRLCLS